MFQTITSSLYLSYTDAAGSPLWVLLLAPVQPLHLKCLRFLSLLHLFLYTSPFSPFLTPLTNPSAVKLPLTLLHPLLSLTTQIHLVGFNNHFQSSAKFLTNNAAKLSLHQHT